DKYYFSPGTWNINEALVLDKPVIIPSGTKLQFSENSYLMIHGSLQANGTEDLPIEFSPLEEKTGWGGIYIRLAKERSLLNNVSFTKTNEFQAGILKLTGGVTFYKSDVTIENSTFSNNNSEDALNIIESDFLISNSNFHNAPSDALDSDFSTGLVASSEFSDIAGDALDYSGSTVTMRDLLIRNIKDKGVSGGENSYLTVLNSNIENSSIGIASKDGSEVKVSGVTITNPTSFSLMTYIKKSFWGIPTLSAENVTMNVENSILAQYGTMLLIDGAEIETEGLDVKSLYQDE
ncbi:MAG: right-handed parallel beta-helix repeat-containing protein, partial [Emcibacteraceae bacterium]|nr:right-handed parallel beta-helix repeat-containing protein [Emcibacteraceae bacterium]